VTIKTTSKLQTKVEKEEQTRHSSALASYFNKTDDNDNEEDDEKTPWDDIKSNDWGETQAIDDDKWDDFSASQPPPPPSQKTTTTAKTSIGSSSASWTQEKPASTTQAKNDWDSDAFFNDVLTTSTKPKLKTTRR
jgi:hypothetical protein